MWHTKLNNVMLSKLPTLYRRLQEKRYNICWTEKKRILFDIF
jgi:hypothetical protein